ncbi:hypothetical protein CMI44_01110 [Candidatus Pacearchaeota archaeon]|nr:hypothetical protein [Candidatus Pacearchaeota archaeon]|tara:strand:+ start:183 stop:1022 length:840 start_codon:yes stop_codon:yes gene_type:complete
MGIIRSGLLVIASVILFTCFLLGNGLWVVSNSLEYESIKSEMTPIVVEIIEEQAGISRVVEDKLPLMQEHCKDNSEFVFGLEGQTFEVSCDSIEQGSDAIVEEAINGVVENIYYDDYDCEFIDCFKENIDWPYFLVSEKTKNYVDGKFYLVLIVCLGLVLVMFFLVETKSNLPILVGSLLIVSSFPFMKLDNFVGYFANKSFLQYFTFLFTKAYSVFLKSFIFGIFLLGLGIFLKFFGWGFKISEIIGRFSKKGKSKKKVSKDKTIAKKDVRALVKKSK